MNLSDMSQLTWKCHICGEERPDDKISVWKTPLVIGGRQVGTQNVRYCNDNPDCFEKAQHYSFIKEG
jgi:hypothetical protein